jgi:hypothetical protein
MTALCEAQRLLAAAIDRVAEPREIARLQGLVAPGAGGVSAAARVAVYRDSSRRARERALEAIYPVCRQVLGQRCFAGMAADYVGAHPSSSGDLNAYGAAFPPHLAARVRTEAALAEVPYLADLARLEWHWHAAYYAADDPAFDAERFTLLAARGAAGGVRLRLSAALRLLASDYPVEEIWRRHRKGGAPAVVAMGGGDRLVIHRVGFRPDVEAVEGELFDLLRAVSSGESLAAIADAGLAVERVPGLVAAGWVVGWSAP